MKYELEFLGVNESTCDADAICFRYFSENKQKYIVGVYDGGTQKYGEALVAHLNKYYFSGVSNPTIDFVICSHTDQDHSSGLSQIMDNFNVNALIMNRPWLYIDDIFDKVSDGRITKKSLEERLKAAYPYIKNLEDKAVEKGVKIYEAFQGVTIGNTLKILSPTRDFYMDLLVESNKTPLSESSVAHESVFSRIVNAIKTVLESWTNELLREDVTTAAENEASVILYGDMECETFLLTGDAGIRALNNAIEYASSIGVELQQVKIHQIPHHGGRHNVSPSVLNALLGPKVDQTTPPTKSAFVSVGKGTDHPKKMVTNAYMRRGAKVFEVRGSTIRHQKGTPDREGWNKVSPMDFSAEVEDWD